MLEELQKKQIEEAQQVKKAYEELKVAQVRQMQNEKISSISQLAAGIAHEINNPIGFISGNFQFIEQYLSGYVKLINLFEKLRIAVEHNSHERIPVLFEEIAQVKKEINFDFSVDCIQGLLGETKAGIERIRHIISNLRIFASTQKEEASRLNLEEVIERVMPLAKFTIKENITIKKEYAPSLFVKGELGLLGQVFMNILFNAAQAIKEKGLIVIRSYKEKSYACVEISDTGVGIPENQIGRIFDPFFTTKPVGQGIGLGLSICQDIVKKYGGDILVASRQGLGSIFTVKLPLLQE